jgi:deoxyribodipyrimidine photo-lyase
MTKTEVLGAVLKAHDFQKAERFVYEIFWRTYFKGWLEQHPTVWPGYQAGLLRQIKSVDKDRRLAANYAAAMAGETGIECFDAWADELVATGYLHNHARMWFGQSLGSPNTLLMYNKCTTKIWDSAGRGGTLGDQS